MTGAPAITLVTVTVVPVASLVTEIPAWLGCEMTLNEPLVEAAFTI